MCGLLCATATNVFIAVYKSLTGWLKSLNITLYNRKNACGIDSYIRPISEAFELEFNAVRIERV